MPALRTISEFVTTRERVGRNMRPRRQAVRLEGAWRRPMSTALNEGSAKIYQFPVGGRAALGGRGLGETKEIDQDTPRVNEPLCSDSWYHEEAIRESQPGFRPFWER